MSPGHLKNLDAGGLSSAFGPCPPVPSRSPPSLRQSRYNQAKDSFMDKFVIRGGEPLLGTVHISGAKNAALPCMAAALLTDQPVILENIPQVRDIQTTRNLLAAMGAEVDLGRARPVGDVVQVALGIGILVVDRRRQESARHAECGRGDP